MIQNYKRKVSLFQRGRCSDVIQGGVSIKSEAMKARVTPNKIPDTVH